MDKYGSAIHVAIWRERQRGVPLTCSVLELFPLCTNVFSHVNFMSILSVVTPLFSFSYNHLSTSSIRVPPDEPGPVQGFLLLKAVSTGACWGLGPGFP